MYLDVDVPNRCIDASANLFFCLSVKIVVLFASHRHANTTTTTTNILAIRFTTVTVIDFYARDCQNSIKRRKKGKLTPSCLSLPPLYPPLVWQLYKGFNVDPHHTNQTALEKIFAFLKRTTFYPTTYFEVASIKLVKKTFPKIIFLFFYSKQTSNSNYPVQTALRRTWFADFRKEYCISFK